MFVMAFDTDECVYISRSVFLYCKTGHAECCSRINGKFKGLIKFCVDFN